MVQYLRCLDGRWVGSLALASSVLVGPMGASRAWGAPPLEDGYGGDPTDPLDYALEGIAPTPTHDRTFDMEVNFRVRSVSVPKSVLDVWYYDADDADWAYFEPRPHLAGTAIGLEYVVKNESANGIFYAEFVDSAMSNGYWDDIEEPANHLDGDYLSPSRGMGLVAFGANYAYEAHLVRIEDTEGQLGLSFLIGGGLGLGVLAGRLDRWGPDNNGNPAYKRFLDGVAPDSDKAVPRVYPMVDVNAGLRFNLGNRAVIRLEGGLHTLLYYGTSVGVMF